MIPTRAPIDVPLTLLAILTGLCSALLVLVVLLLVVTLRRRRESQPTSRPAARRGKWTGDFTPFAVGDPGRAARRSAAAARSAVLGPA